jgi:hypothetical protein
MRLPLLYSIGRVGWKTIVGSRDPAVLNTQQTAGRDVSEMLLNTGTLNVISAQISGHSNAAILSVHAHQGEDLSHFLLSLSGEIAITTPSDCLRFHYHMVNKADEAASNF